MFKKIINTVTRKENIMKKPDNILDTMYVMLDLLLEQQINDADIIAELAFIIKDPHQHLADLNFLIHNMKDKRGKLKTDLDELREHIKTLVPRFAP